MIQIFGFCRILCWCYAIICWASHTCFRRLAIRLKFREFDTVFYHGGVVVLFWAARWIVFLIIFIFSYHTPICIRRFKCDKAHLWFFIVNKSRYLQICDFRWAHIQIFFFMFLASRTWSIKILIIFESITITINIWSFWIWVWWQLHRFLICFLSWPQNQIWLLIFHRFIWIIFENLKIYKRAYFCKKYYLNIYYIW